MAYQIHDWSQFYFDINGALLSHEYVQKVCNDGLDFLVITPSHNGTVRDYHRPGEYPSVGAYRFRFKLRGDPRVFDIDCFIRFEFAGKYHAKYNQYYTVTYEKPNKPKVKWTAPRFNVYTNRVCDCEDCQHYLCESNERVDFVVDDSLQITESGFLGIPDEIRSDDDSDDVNYDKKLREARNLEELFNCMDQTDAAWKFVTIFTSERYGYPSGK